MQVFLRPQNTEYIAKLETIYKIFRYCIAGCWRFRSLIITQCFSSSAFFIPPWRTHVLKVVSLSTFSYRWRLSLHMPCPAWGNRWNSRLELPARILRALCVRVYLRRLHYTHHRWNSSGRRREDWGLCKGMVVSSASGADRSVKSWGFLPNDVMRVLQSTLIPHWRKATWRILPNIVLWCLVLSYLWNKYEQDVHICQRI